MKRVVSIRLTGHYTTFELDDDGQKALTQYLNHAKRVLGDETDLDEVLGDLERSIGDKLEARLSVDVGHVFSRVEIEEVLDEIGAVGAGDEAASLVGRQPGLRRQLVRIREDRWFAGVATGIAAYGGYDVAWVRSLFVILAVFTGGILVIVYLAMAFMLPEVLTLDDYEALISQDQDVR